MFSLKNHMFFNNITLNKKYINIYKLYHLALGTHFSWARSWSILLTVVANVFLVGIHLAITWPISGCTYIMNQEKKLTLWKRETKSGKIHLLLSRTCIPCFLRTVPSHVWTALEDLPSVQPDQSIVPKQCWSVMKINAIKLVCLSSWQ